MEGFCYNKRMNDWELLISKVKEWGESKELNDPIMQYAKYQEENGEIAHELTRNHLSGPELEDAFGDAAICYIILANILGIDIYKAISDAISIVSKRTGKTIKGSFVKDE